MPGGAGGRPLRSSRRPARRGAEPRRPDSAPARLVPRRAGTARARAVPRTRPPGRRIPVRPAPESRLQGRGGPAVGAAGRLPLRAAATPAPVCGLCREHAQLLPGPFLPAAVPPPPSLRLRPGGALVSPPCGGACESSRTSPLGSCSGDTPARAGRHCFSDTRAKRVRSRWWCRTVSVAADRPRCGPCR